MSLISLNLSQHFAVSDSHAEKWWTFYYQIIRRYLVRQQIDAKDLDDAVQESLWLAFTEDWPTTKSGHYLCAKRAARKWLFEQFRLRDRRHITLELDERKTAKNSGPERVELRETIERISQFEDKHREILRVATLHGHVPGDWRESKGLSRSGASRLLEEARQLLGPRRPKRRVRPEIIKLLHAGWPTQQVAERFGVCRMYVTQIASQEKICLTVSIGDRLGKRLARDIGKMVIERRLCDG